ncbi:hypothetical protein CK203_090455 [Vitis vinifera]|uniref:Uncharacterized protein n=1 Tax=Vitis vinifera TaxID=29760 RepID=A0A438BVK0_VITVI|nr:hypothetical protein CK203_090455 [Vitis vinifera]
MRGTRSQMTPIKAILSKGFRWSCGLKTQLITEMVTCRTGWSGPVFKTLLIRYEADLKRMCTINKWCGFNKDRSRKSLRDKVSNLILTDRFWKKVGEVQTIMEPLIKVLKLVDQDKKFTLSIIYEQ